MGLESFEGRFTGASGLGVTVTRGWMVPRKQFNINCRSDASKVCRKHGSKRINLPDFDLLSSCPK